MTGPEIGQGDRPRRSPSSRTPQWVREEEVLRLAKALRAELAPPPKQRRWGHLPPSKRQKRRRGRAGRVIPALCTAVAVAVIGTWYVSPGLVVKATDAIAGEQFPAPVSGIGPVADGRWKAGYPPRGIEASREPLGVPGHLAQTSEAYSMMHEDSQGRPVAYDLCRPIHYVTRPDNAPPGGRELVTEAIAAASRASGLVFIDDGDTSEAYSADRSVYQPGRYGKRWAPVLIVWETETENSKFTNRGIPGVKEYAGFGGSQAIGGSSGSGVYVTGTIQLNAPILAGGLQRAGEAAQVGGVIQHEIGHLLGLDHVQDPTQLMYGHGQAGVTTYAAGDLTGLARLGQGKCFPKH